MHGGVAALGVALYVTACEHICTCSYINLVCGVCSIIYVK